MKVLFDFLALRYDGFSYVPIHNIEMHIKPERVDLFLSHKLSLYLPPRNPNLFIVLFSS